MRDEKGITIVEILVGIAMLALVFSMVSPVFLVKAESHRRVIEGSIPALIAESLRDAILVGARENYDAANNSFFFDFEGVRIRVPLPAPNAAPLHLPYDATPQQGLYPLGTVYFTAEHMVVNGVDLGLLRDDAGNVIRGELVGIPLDEDQDDDGVLDPGEDLNGSGLLDTFEDTNANHILDSGEDLNGDGFLNAPDRRTTNRSIRYRA